MPTTVADAFSAVALVPEDVVRWGIRPSTGDSGVYVVSLTVSTDAIETTLPEAPLAAKALETWLQVLPKLTLDDGRPTVEELMKRIRAFWLADETILYIGLATSLSSRLGDYYKTPIGARRPHSGGYFLKLLSNLDALWVHYARTADPAGAEDGMLGRFCANVSDESRRALVDPTHPFPFANLRVAAGGQESSWASRSTGASCPGTGSSADIPVQGSHPYGLRAGCGPSSNSASYRGRSTSRADPHPIDWQCLDEDPLSCDQDRDRAHLERATRSWLVEPQDGS